MTTDDTQRTMTLPGPPSHQQPRREVFPLGRSSRRRWVVAMYLLAAGWIAIIATELRVSSTGSSLLLVAWAWLGALAGVQFATRRVGAPFPGSLDERDQVVRADAMAVAQRMTRAALLVAAVAALALEVVNPAGLSWHAVFAATLVALAFVMTLPTAILAWREPEPLTEEYDPSARTELVRDLMTLCGLVAGAAAAIVFSTAYFLLTIAAAWLPLIAAGFIGRAYVRRRAGPSDDGRPRGG